MVYRLQYLVRDLDLIHRKGERTQHKSASARIPLVSFFLPNKIPAVIQTAAFASTREKMRATDRPNNVSLFRWSLAMMDAIFNPLSRGRYH
jgi:hypothetical protein